MAKHGGKRIGAGRKTKADEEKIRHLGIEAIIKVFGSVEGFFEHIARESVESFPHLKLLMEYTYGKPKEQKDDNSNVPVIINIEGKDIDTRIDHNDN